MIYQAFGLIIDSEIELMQLKEQHTGTPDIYIKKGTVPEHITDDYEGKWIEIRESEVLFRIEKIANYHIQNGTNITVALDSDISEMNRNMVQVYLMGTAMGAILIQRGTLPMHGSCVYHKEKGAILFTGVSGAGKSTTAASFLKHGWKLISDDVTPLSQSEGKVIATPSFPQQKLWEDAVARQNLEDNTDHVLWSREDQTKFAMDSQKAFYGQSVPLDMVIQLIPTEREDHVRIEEVTGLEKAILLREHTYRNFLYESYPAKQNHFRECAGYASMLKTYHLFRPIGKETESELYEQINQQFEKTIMTEKPAMMDVTTGGDEYA